MSAAVLGITGSYSEEAAKRFLGLNSRVIGCADFAEVFSAVRDGKARYAVLPVNNTITGRIEAAVNLLEASEFRVVDQIEMQVCHILAGTPAATLEKVRTIISHPEALRQCAGLFSRFPGLESIPAEDTATGVLRVVMEGKPETAAICSRRAAQKHGAKILLEDIADDTLNKTTFVLAEWDVDRKGRKK